MTKNMKTIDVNCDMGEGFGAYPMGGDTEIMPLITSANVACGFHAGDPLVMEATVKAAARNGVAVGAHPGYPDLLGFGRRFMACTVEELRAYLIYQIGALQAFCAVHNLSLRHVKPHGALYNAAMADTDIAGAVVAAVAAVDRSLVLVTLAGGGGETIRRLAAAAGLKTAAEAFPDRAYSADGALAPRKLPGAVIQDPATVAQRALMMAVQGCVIAIDGATRIPLAPDTLCIHGDTPMAAALAGAIATTFQENGIVLKAMGT